MFTDFFLIEGYRQGALREEPVIDPSTERFKKASLRKSY